MEAGTIAYKGYTITTEKALLSKKQIHHWLSVHSYWAKGISEKNVYTSIEHSFCIGIIKDGQQIGFARLITDYATFAYLADVYVEEGHRGKGLSKKMLETLLEIDWVKGLRRIMLATLDAHGLYKQFEFANLKFPERLMEIVRTSLYQSG